jgi:hypothetical protein
MRVLGRIGVTHVGPTADNLPLLNGTDYVMLSVVIDYSGIPTLVVVATASVHHLSKCLHFQQLLPLPFNHLPALLKPIFIDLQPLLTLDLMECLALPGQ